MSSAATWIERYAAAWRGRDAAAAASLFALDATYVSDPFGSGLHGREAIVEYWAQATANQEKLDLRMGAPIVDGDRAAVEWRASFRRAGAAVALAACLMLRFDADGRCLELREYWRER
jgi:uncharacterized protein (TIGR02246 family)